MHLRQVAMPRKRSNRADNTNNNNRLSDCHGTTSHSLSRLLLVFIGPNLHTIMEVFALSWLNA
ncbi:hypothetical protein OUZ56_030735 [Daphnia magna]|uniref:Uncharacterized protein n=1 Tax=Daphnia magna TaxID=35525 RepID=A0ABQ9ZS60_9CRUS|nr:hypothetical protein OUZ56_030735 [Daphnia magna]